MNKIGTNANCSRTDAEIVIKAEETITFRAFRSTALTKMKVARRMKLSAMTSEVKNMLVMSLKNKVGRKMSVRTCAVIKSKNCFANE
jgi:hypothetical protein